MTRRTAAALLLSAVGGLAATHSLVAGPFMSQWKQQQQGGNPIEGASYGFHDAPSASGFVGPVGSLCIGIAAGILCYWGCTGLKHMLGYDDALDAFGVHAVGGVVGALLTGVFAIEQYGGTAGLIEGNAVQVLNQIEGIVIVFVYDAIVSLIILKVIDIFIGLRVSDEVEREGLDLALHGETVH